MKVYVMVTKIFYRNLNEMNLVLKNVTLKNLKNEMNSVLKNVTLKNLKNVKKLVLSLAA